MFRGTDANGQYNNIGELDILDTDGNDLIDNGTLDANDFTYRYGGGYFSTQYGPSLFDNSQSSAYANAAFSVDTGQKWVLIDLGQTVEVGSLTIQARSNSTSHINRITHMTVFTSNRNDTGFAYSGTENTNNNNENLVLERSIDQMKLDPSLKWRDLNGYSTNQTSNNYTKANQAEDAIAPVITSPVTANAISENSGAGQEIYTVTATDNVGVTSYAIAGADASAFTINANTGVVTLVDNPDFETQEYYTFEVTATDAAGYTSVPLTVSLTVDNLVAWGQTRYIMFRGQDDKDPLETYLINNIGEVDILDTGGNNLIDNGTLNKNDFEYSYGGGFWSSSSAVDLFDNDPSDAYANHITSATANTAEKWVLIDLNQTVEIGSITIQSRSSSDDHIARIAHMTLFTSDRDDTGFTFTGTPTGDTDENLLLGTTKEQMKLDPSLKWRDLNGYSTNQTSNNYTNGIQAEDTIAPVITSPVTANAISENSGAGQEIYTVTATDNVGVTSYAIAGADASAFTINANTGVVTLVDNPDIETQEYYSFEVTATDAAGYTSVPLTVSLTVDNLVAWGETRYIMFRGTDANGQYNNIGELDILDTDGNDLIDNGTLDANDFTYRYGGGYFSTQYGPRLFDNSQSSAYANASFSVDNGEKWVLIDLGQTVEVGSLTIQARSNSIKSY